jgi:hypothetical protein
LLGEKAAILANRSVQVDVFTNELAATFDLVPRDTADIAPNKQ